MPKILFMDTETSFMKIAKFSLYPEYTNPKNIIQDWNMYCAAWKWQSSKAIYSVKVGEDVTDDRDVVAELADAVESADIVIAHNGDKFDLKKLNTRLIHHGLKGLRPKKHMLTIDTLKVAKKYFSFTSNRLDYLGKYLGVGQKLQTKDGLWMDVLNGDQKALKDMVTYCKQDVNLLELVYNRLAPYMESIEVSERRCPESRCEGMMIKSKLRILADGITTSRQFKCTRCGIYTTVRGVD